MIFLSVSWGIYGIGDAATFGRIGKRMMLTYTGIALLSSACGAMLFPLLGPGISSGTGSGGQLSSIAELLLGIFPSTIVEPFATGNTLQIIFLAIVIGTALLYLGRQTSSVARAIEQVNLLVQFLMEIISKLVPFVIFLVLVNMIWSDSLSVMASAWKLIIVLAAAFLTAGAVFTIITAVRLKVSPLILARKSMPAFLVALTTASSAAAFGKNVSACEEKFGIDPGAQVMDSAEIGEGSVITDDAFIDDNVKIGDDVFIGANASLRDRITIGSGSVVSIGSAVLNDMPENATAIGNPARVVFNSEGTYMFAPSIGQAENAAAAAKEAAGESVGTADIVIRYFNAFTDTFHDIDFDPVRFHAHDAGWDSLAQMTLIAELEEAFDVELEGQDPMEVDSYKSGLELNRRTACLAGKIRTALGKKEGSP